MGWLKKYQNGGYSTTGYKADSPDRNNPYNIIPSGRITMQNVPHSVLGIDNFGNKQMMMPGGEYQFQGNEVFEMPVMKSGGTVPTINDAGNFKDGVWVPDLATIKQQAKKLGSRTVKTKSGSIINFDENWNIKSVDDAPAMQKGGVAPIYVDNINDPRYRAYQDSLNLHNAGYAAKLALLTNSMDLYGQQIPIMNKAQDNLTKLNKQFPTFLPDSTFEQFQEPKQLVELKKMREGGVAPFVTSDEKIYKQRKEKQLDSNYLHDHLQADYNKSSIDNYIKNTVPFDKYASKANPFNKTPTYSQAVLENASRKYADQHYVNNRNTLRNINDHLKQGSLDDYITQVEHAPQDKIRREQRVIGHSNVPFLENGLLTNAVGAYYSEIPSQFPAATQDVIYEAPKAKAKNKISKLPIINQQSQFYQPQQTQIPQYTPRIPNEWYGNKVGVPIDAEDVSALYNEDGTPKYTQEMKEGGIPQRYKTMGFSRVGQKKSGDGQHKWKVLAKKGDSYKVVQGGYRGMQDFKQHGSEDRKDRFWDRMGGRNSSKAKDPFSPLYWHKRFGTWEYGGPVEMQAGGPRKDLPKNLIPASDPYQRSHYDHVTGKMYLTADQYNNPDVYNHESFHEFQDRAGRLSVPEMWEGPLKRPAMVASPEVQGAYYNRQGLDANIIGNRFLQRHPDFQFVPAQVMYEKYIDAEKYRQPWTVEGEAVDYENYMHDKKMQGGGVAPYITHDPNDPRIQAHKDSTEVYNSYLQHLEALKNHGYTNRADPGWLQRLSSSGMRQAQDQDKNQVGINTFVDYMSNVNPNGVSNRFQSIGRDRYLVKDDWLGDPKTNPFYTNTELPYTVYNKNIKPKSTDRWESNKSRDVPHNYFSASKFPNHFIEKEGLDPNRVYGDALLNLNYSNAQPVQDVIYQPLPLKVAPTPIKSPKKKTTVIPTPKPPVDTPQKSIPIPQKKIKYQFIKKDSHGVRESPIMDERVEPEWYATPKYKQGGMIKRADGSYSQRGLWDNIRANAGSGKKPTKEMLQQEKKIRGAEKKEYGGWLDQYQSGGQIRYTNSVNQPIAPTVSQNPTTPGKLDPQEQAAIQRRLYELQANQKMYQRPTDYRTPAEKQYYEQKRITELEKEGLTPEGYPTGRTKVNRALDPAAELVEKGMNAAIVYDAGLLGAKGLRTLAKKVGNKISIPRGYTGPMMTDLVPIEPVYPTSPYRPPGGRTFPVLPARTPTGMPTLVDVPELTKEQQILKSFGLDPHKTKAEEELVSLYRARPIGQDPAMNIAAGLRARQAAGENLTWWQRQLINPQTDPDMIAREKYYGQWFEKDPNRLDWYLNSGSNNFGEGKPLEILKYDLPKSEAMKYNVANFEDADKLSRSSETEFILPKELIEKAQRYPASDWQKLIDQHKAWGLLPVGFTLGALKSAMSEGESKKHGGWLSKYK
jgi:hypothetical protein